MAKKRNSASSNSPKNSPQEEPRSAAFLDREDGTLYDFIVGHRLVAADVAKGRMPYQNANAIARVHTPIFKMIDASIKRGEKLPEKASKLLLS